MLEGDASRTRDRAWLVFYTGYLKRFSGQGQTLRSLDEALRLAELGHDELLTAIILYHRGASRAIQGDIRRGIEGLERGVATLDELATQARIPSTEEILAATLEAMISKHEGQDQPAQTPSLGNDPEPDHVTQQRGVLINWLGHAGRYREAIETGEPFIAKVVEKFGDDHFHLQQCMSGHMGLGHAYAALGRPRDAARHYALARQGSTGWMFEYNSFCELLLVTLPYRSDHTAERRQLASQAGEAWGRLVGTVMGATHEASAQLLLDLFEGRWAKARKTAEASRNSPLSPYYQGAALGIGNLARWQGDPGLAWEQVHTLHPDGPATEPGDSYFPFAIGAQRLAAELALDTGDMETARTWIEAHDRWLTWSGVHLWRAEGQLLWSRYYSQDGNPRLTREHAGRALEYAEDPRQPAALIAVHRALGRIETGERRFAKAREYLQSSLALADACNTPYERALTSLALADLDAAEGNPDGARALLASVRETCVPIQASLALAQADLIEASINTRISKQRNFGGLSDREVEVLRLAARGLTNNDIGEKLFISPRTVGHHLSSIYNKLGVNSRAAAVARFAEFDPA